MAKCYKKPKEFEVWRWMGTNIPLEEKIPGWVQDAMNRHPRVNSMKLMGQNENPGNRYIIVHTSGYTMAMCGGDYLLHDSLGRLSVCKASDFDRLYTKECPSI